MNLNFLSYFGHGVTKVVEECDILDLKISLGLVCVYLILSRIAKVCSIWSLGE